MPGAAAASSQNTVSSSASSTNSSTNGTAASSSSSSSDLLNTLAANSLDTQSSADLSADPNNLTSQLVNNFLQTTLNKSQSDSNFTTNPSYSTDEVSQMIQSSLSSTDISKDLPAISDSDIKILPAVDDKKLTADEKKAKEKEQIQTYLSSAAFIFATNAPFPVDTPDNLTSSLQNEQSNLISALTSGDQTKINDYAQRAQAGIDQLKNVEVPYVLKDIHKSILQLAIYTLGFKDKVTIDPSDPTKSLAAFSSLQAVAESSLKLQDELSAILQNYGIDTIALNK